jgi:hypothetical protein
MALDCGRGCASQAETDSQTSTTSAHRKPAESAVSLVIPSVAHRRHLFEIEKRRTRPIGDDAADSQVHAPQAIGVEHDGKIGLLAGSGPGPGTNSLQ